jgi:hypothetical protein
MLDSNSGNFQRSSFRKAFLYIVLAAPIFGVLALLYPLVISDPASDLLNYQYFFDNGWTMGTMDAATWFEPGYSIFSLLCSLMMTFSDYVWFVGFIVSVSIFASQARFLNNVVVVTVLSMLAYFFFFPFSSLSNVALRQGLASSAFLFFIGSGRLELISFRQVLAWSLFFFSFHSSSAFLFVALVLFIYIRGVHALYFWLIVSLLYVGGVSGQLGFFLNEQMGFFDFSLTALNIEADYTVGFKPKFLALSGFFVAAPFVLARLRAVSFDFNELLEIPIFKLYLILNAMAMFMVELPYHDRFFLWSWIMGPALLSFFIGKSSFRFGL